MVCDTCAYVQKQVKEKAVKKSKSGQAEAGKHRTEDQENVDLNSMAAAQDEEPQSLPATLNISK